MKHFINKMLFGKDNRLSGVIALSIVAMIALGCTCGKNFDLGNLQSESNSSGSNRSNSSEPAFDDDNTTKGSKSPGKSTTKADASKGEMPSDEELQEMAKATLLDFNAAVQKDDFTEFYETICEPWKKQVTAETLRKSFGEFVQKGIDISPISSLDAEFSPAPEIGREVGFKTLKLKGSYSTNPNKTKFELNYIPEGKEWKLSKIIVDTTEKNF